MGAHELKNLHCGGFLVHAQGIEQVEGVGEPRSVPRGGDDSEPWVLKERSDVRFPCGCTTKNNYALAGVFWLCTSKPTVLNPLRSFLHGRNLELFSRPHFRAKWDLAVHETEKKISNIFMCEGIFILTLNR